MTGSRFSSQVNDSSDPRLEGKIRKLTQALLLEEQVRKKTALKNEIGFHITNDTLRLISYRQCYLWSVGLDKVSVTHASGVSHVEQDSPFIQWLSGLIKRTIRNPEFSNGSEQRWASLHELSRDDCPAQDQDQWNEWLHAYAIIVLFWGPDGQCFGGIWFDRETPFHESDKMLLSQVCDAYGHSLYMVQQLETRAWTEKTRAFLWGTKLRRALVIGLVALVLFPVRMSATAPAEVIPEDPYMISAPMDAVIEDIHVEPNQTVEAGQTLVTFDDAQLQNQKEVAEKEIQILRTELSQASRQAFSEDRSKAQLALITAQIATKRSEISYLEKRLERMSVKAPHSGRVIFVDPSELRGQPMQTGQRLMLLAKPQESELLVRIPVENMIRTNHDVPVRAFLNIAPLTQYDSTIRYVSYQASADSDGLMTYKVKARFNQSEDRPVIGLQGTAKVYGGYTILAYHVLRRPLAWLRKQTGI